MSPPKGKVNTEYLRIVGNFLNQLKQRTYDQMQVQSGQIVLDVGCGPGTDTIPLAKLVGPTGHVVGVDYDEAMVTEADKRSEKAGVSAWVEHKLADTSSLPFASEHFDACRSERLFQHLHNPAQALSEMTRVTKTNGWIIVLDTDWGTLSTDTSEVDIERRLVRFLTEQRLQNGYAGRQLYRLFKKQGLADVTFEVFPVVGTNYNLARQIWAGEKLEQAAITANIITEEELCRWRTSLEQSDAEEVFFSYACMVMVTGRKTGQS